MHKLTWYRQKRFDGGVRTAVTADGDTIFHLFEHRSDDPDPALLWYLDFRWEGPRLPVVPEKARQWLLDQVEVVRANLATVAEELTAGVDVDAWPLQRSATGFPPKIKGTIVCSVTRRLDGLAIAEVFRDVAANWEKRIRALPAEQPAQAG